MTSLAIDIQNLSKKFGDRTVVNNLSLQVPRGSVFGFLGSNGSGKTTTIRMICGLLIPTSGSGKCLDLDITSESGRIRDRIGYMAQKFCLYDELIVYLQLAPYRNLRAKQLSGGWRQRLSLASCLLHEPELLFLDEPTAGVDPKARKEFWDYLHDIAI